MASEVSFVPFETSFAHLKFPLLHLKFQRPHPKFGLWHPKLRLPRLKWVPLDTALKFQCSFINFTAAKEPKDRKKLLVSGFLAFACGGSFVQLAPGGRTSFIRAVSGNRNAPP
jgi:hypothetical protein